MLAVTRAVLVLATRSVPAVTPASLGLGLCEHLKPRCFGRPTSDRPQPCRRGVAPDRITYEHERAHTHAHISERLSAAAMPTSVDKKCGKGERGARVGRARGEEWVGVCACCFLEQHSARPIAHGLQNLTPKHNDVIEHNTLVKMYTFCLQDFSSIYQVHDPIFHQPA